MQRIAVMLPEKKKKEIVAELLCLSDKYEPSAPAVAALITMVAASTSDDCGVEFHNYCLPSGYLFHKIYSNVIK